MTNAYTLWVLNDNYSKRAQLERFLRCKFTVQLNGMAPATEVDLLGNYSKIADVTLAKRLLINRNGMAVWGGRLLGEGWTIGERAPEGDNYALDAYDHAHYAMRRIVSRPAGQDYWTATDHLDDIAKALVRTQMGASADVARQYSDLTVEADAHGAALTTVNLVGGTVHQYLQSLAKEGGFYWRFEPTASGCIFKTALAWGKDRTRGNGSNSEMIFALDRKNFAEMSYRRDAAKHANVIYVAGGGEGKGQLVEVVSDAAAVTAWGRAEAWISESSYTASADLQARGAAALEQRKVVEAMIVRPNSRAVWGTHYDLGDMVTGYIVRYGRVFDYDFRVMGVEVEIAIADQATMVRETPLLEAA